MPIELGGGSMRLISGFDIDGWCGGIDLANQRDEMERRFVNDVTIGGTVATEWSEDLLTRLTTGTQYIDTGVIPTNNTTTEIDFIKGTLLTDEPTEELDRFFDSMVVRKD